MPLCCSKGSNIADLIVVYFSGLLFRGRSWLPFARTFQFLFLIMLFLNSPGKINPAFVVFSSFQERFLTSVAL